jgi:hypothetical protein
MTDRMKSAAGNLPKRGKAASHAAEASHGSQIGIALQRKIQLARTGFNEKIGGQAFDRSHFDIVPLSLFVSDLDPAFHGYRIVQISDIHLGQWITPERLRGVVDLVNEQEPDLVAITGDSVSYVLDGLAKDLGSSLAKLQPKDATVAVLGNHDHWMGAENIRSIYRLSKVIDLSNDVLTLRRGDAVLNIAGVDDVLVNRQRLDLVLKKLSSGGPAVLLAHEPDFAEISAKTGRFCLQLSGHSHGGQLVLPKIGTPIRGFMFGKYPLGRYQVGDMVQYTNRGLGTNLIWSRINCPPEITVISLKRP